MFEIDLPVQIFIVFIHIIFILFLARLDKVQKESYCTTPGVGVGVGVGGCVGVSKMLKILH